MTRASAHIEEKSRDDAAQPIMRFVRSRHIWLVAAIACSVSAACGGRLAIDDEATAGETKRDASVGADPDDGDGDAGQPTASEDSAPPVTRNAFTGAPVFLGGSPAGRTSIDAHGKTGNAGQDCASCHKIGGDPNARAYVFSGTVKQNYISNEVRVVTSTGDEICGIVKTDSVGNFWCIGDTPAPADARAAVRNQKGVRAMNGPIVSGSCNSSKSCHGGAQGLIEGP